MLTNYIKSIIMTSLFCSFRGNSVAYNSFVFNDFPHWELVPAADIANWHWEGAEPFRPLSYARLCGVAGKGIYAQLWSFEENPRCVCQKRDEPVYTDSCLELFLQPVCGNDAYVNFEINCKGVYLAEFGEKRQNRVFIKEYCALEPVITPFKPVENDTAWGVGVFLSDALIAEMYGTVYQTKPGTMHGNFYKCGDKTPRAHFGAYFPAGSAALGFHNPSKFGSIILK
jgi:hypothetical protein